MVILGIDPGLATIGIGLVEKTEAQNPVKGHGPHGTLRPTSERLRLVECCTIETSPAFSAAERLRELAEDLQDILKEHRPTLAIIEKLYFERNQKTAMAVAEARGVILLTVQQHGIIVLEPTPLELKLAITGDGRADKRQMRDMLLRTLTLDAEAFRGFPDDAVDAVALALFGAVWRAPSLTEV